MRNINQFQVESHQPTGNNSVVDTGSFEFFDEAMTWITQRLSENPKRIIRIFNWPALSPNQNVILSQYRVERC